jgi:hypothetical protein
MVPALFWIGMAAAAALEPAALRSALACAAGTAYEAAPFVVAAGLLPRGLRPLAGALGCGCGGRLPGALSLPAAALCWLSFGPATALARAAAALALALAARRPRPRAGCDVYQPEAPRASGMLEELADLARAAALAALARELVVGPALALAGPLGEAAALAGGLLLGVLLPCATAGVAVAAALGHAAPLAAAGILATSGIQGPLRSRPGARPPRADTRFGLAALSLTLGALALHGPSGLVSPRLLPLEAAAAAALLVPLRAATPSAAAHAPRAGAVPAVMLVALVSGSPVPVYRTGATQLDGAFAGERVSFTGSAEPGPARTTLVRFAITCCRIDAAPIALRLDRRLPVRAGAWIETAGVLNPAPDGTLALRVERWRPIPPPADPFVYR